MNKKAILRSGLEYDCIVYKSMYCYVQNNPSIVRFAKTALRRRLRKEGKEIIKRELNQL